MNGKILAPALALILGLTTGCVTAPAANTEASYASALGDRSTALLDEVVVSLPLRGSDAPYHNLHVVLVVFTNPTRPTPGSPYEVEALVRRHEARVGAQVGELLARAGPQSVAGVQSLRPQIIQEAEAVLQKVLSGWKYAADYRVEVAVHSLYWTDASVGKSARTGRGF